MRKHGWVPALVLWIYVMVASVSLVNLLVAMFSDSDSRIKPISEVEFKCQKYEQIFQYLFVMHPIPPPFNLLHVLCGASAR